MIRMIIIAAAVIMILGLLYLMSRIRKFSFVQKISGGKRSIAWLLSAVPLPVIFLFGRADMVNTVIVVLHLLVFWLLCDLLGFLIKRALRRQSGFYWQGCLAIAVTVVYLGIGWYLDHHVWETDYVIETSKDLGTEQLRIVQISDSHLGTTFDGEGFAKHLERIQETHPDLVVVTGDFVDDDSTREDMRISCEALGKLQTTYGVYYIFGNHDEGYFQYRGFTGAEMVAELEKNHVAVLEDETVMITDHISLTGRKDRSSRERLSAEELVDGLDTSNYMILLDHQPHDFDRESDAGFDLVLCGHTHGGQMFPIGITGELSGANDKTYGLEVRKNTTFIVNSGISDWAIKFKTGTFSEFGVIDIREAAHE